jgi:hypothetical protein
MSKWHRVLVESFRGDILRRDMTSLSASIVILIAWALSAHAAVRQEGFDQEPRNWQGINNHVAASQAVTQDFGYMAAEGRVGGRITPAAEPAFYACRLPKPLGFDDRLTASGKLYVAPGAGHFLLGFFNASTLNEWRTPNTMVARINGRGEVGFHCHAEYCTGKWRAGAGLIRKSGSYEFKEIPAGRVYDWTLDYKPGDLGGTFKLTLNGESDTVSVPAEHRADGGLFTHFGVLPVLKSLDSPGEFWIDDVTINGKRFDFEADPNWEGLNNRRTYVTRNRRPLFDFGWSPTHHAGGQAAGELGGLIFRGDCRYSQKMACYGDPIGPVTLQKELWASGKVAMTRGVTDSAACFGFYNSTESMRTNSSQSRGFPRSFVGISIEGPSSEGFYFYPFSRTATSDARIPRIRDCPRIYPDGKTHTWSLKYVPPDAITIMLDDQRCDFRLQLAAEELGTSFDRFGICTTWIDGNAVTMHLDDIEYTCAQP